MKSKTKRSPTEPTSLHNSLESSSPTTPLHNSRISHKSRQCQCCKSLPKYPNYIDQLRRERKKKEENKQAINKKANQEIVDADSNQEFLEKVDEIIDEQFSSHKKNERLSQLQKTPERKKSLMKSFHQSIIKSKSKMSPSIENILMKPRSPSPKQKFYFSIQVVIGGKKCYMRNFSGASYGIKAISCIENILRKYE